MKTVKRFDRGALQKPQHMPNGWVRFDAYIARSGILEYMRADGSMWREYRPPEENAAALGSFDLVPFTNNHPREGLLDADNTRAYQVGIVYRPEADGDKVRAQILCTDAATVADIKAGKADISCGYVCDVFEEPGEVDGQRYDAIQRNVRGNHVALVRAGRAGPDVRLRVDSDAEILQADSDGIGSKESPAMKKVRIDGVEYEVSETAAQAFEKAQAAQAEALKAKDAEIVAAKADGEKATARADAAEADAKKAREELAAAPEQLKAAMKARAELEAQAAKVLPGEKFDGKTDAEIRRAVAEKAGVKCEGKSDAYVEAAFDFAVQNAHEPSALANARSVTSPIHRGTADSAPDLSTAQAAYAAKLNSHFSK